MSVMRLDRFFSNQEILSRRDVAICVKKGFIYVNDNNKIKPDMKIDTDKDVVFYNNEQIIYKEFIYLMLNKPKGVVSATRDNLHKTVVDIIDDKFKRSNMFPAGRLDKDTIGFVLLTTDGDMSHKILSPKNHIEKEYIAILDKAVDKALIDEFKRGIQLSEDEFLKPAELEILTNIDKNSLFYIRDLSDDEMAVRIVISEGKYHQIKRMFLKYYVTVVELKRIRMGEIYLDINLLEGMSRELTKDEMEYLTTL